jgi:hypothetical protein
MNKNYLDRNLLGNSVEGQRSLGYLPELTSPSSVASSSSPSTRSRLKAVQSRDGARRAASVMQRVPQTEPSHVYEVWPAPRDTRVLAELRTPLRKERKRDQDRDALDALLPSVVSPQSPLVSVGVRNLEEVSPLRTEESIATRAGASKDILDCIQDKRQQPQLLKTLKAMISTGLARLSLEYPDQENPKTPPPTLSAMGSSSLQELQGTPSSEDHVLFQSPFAASMFARPEDRFAASRLNVFLRVGELFCSHFQTYAPILKWIFAEHMVFVEKAVALLMDERSKVARERLDLSNETARLHEYLGQLESQNHSLEESLSEVSGQVAALQKERDDAVAYAKEAKRLMEKAESTIAVQEEEKGVLARRILELERSVDDWIEKARAPARQLISLRSQLEGKTDIIKKLGEMNERALTEISVLKRQCSLLQSQRNQATPGPRAMKMLEGECADLLRRQRLLDDTIQKLTSAQAVNERELLLLREAATTNSRYDDISGAVLTPRPKILSVHLPTAPSTTVTMMEAAAKLERQDFLIRQQERTIQALAQLRDLTLEDLKRHVKVDALGVLLPSPKLSRTWLVGLGEDENIPLFLRANGRVRNLKFTLSQAKQFVRTFRANQPSGDVDPLSFAGSPMGERLQVYCASKFTIEQATEAIYSIHHAVTSVHTSDPELSLFRQILFGEVDEAVWHTHVRTVNEVKYAMLDKLKSIREGSLSKLQVCALLAKFFSLMLEEDVGRLFIALNKDHVGEGIDVYALFKDPIGKPGQFVQSLFDLLAVDRERYVVSIEEAILAQRDVATGLVTVPIFMTAALTADPSIPHDILHLRAQELFQVSELQVSAKEGLPFPDRYHDHCGSISLPLREAVRRIRFLDWRRFTKAVNPAIEGGPAPAGPAKGDPFHSSPTQEGQPAEL